MGDKTRLKCRMRYYTDLRIKFALIAVLKVLSERCRSLVLYCSIEGC